MNILMVSVLVAASVLPPRSQQFLDNTTRIISRDMTTIPGSVVTTMRKAGQEWCVTNTVKPIFGVPASDPVSAVERRLDALTPQRFSKLRIIVAAKAAGKWDIVKQFIRDNDFEDEWLACSYITPDNQYFISATNAVVTGGIATDAEIKVFLDSATDTEGNR